MGRVACRGCFASTWVSSRRWSSRVSSIATSVAGILWCGDVCLVMSSGCKTVNVWFAWWVRVGFASDRSDLSSVNVGDGEMEGKYALKIFVAEGIREDELRVRWWISTVDARQWC